MFLAEMSRALFGDAERQIHVQSSLRGSAVSQPITQRAAVHKGEEVRQQKGQTGQRALW